MNRHKVGILLFDEVEVLDFAGPYEVFSRTRLEGGIDSRRTEDSAPFRVFTVAQDSGVVRATGGLGVLPDYSLTDAPDIDVLVIPGGFGTRALLGNDRILDWIRQQAGKARFTTSVCTGALLLARCGLLAGRRATTHWGAYDFLSELAPDAEVRREERVVYDGVITSAGVAAGIDMALMVVELLHGGTVAEETARYIEFPRQPI